MAFSLALLGLGTLIGLMSEPAVTQAAPSDRPSVQAGSWVYTSVTYLSENHDVNVYLPASYPVSAPYPVIYLLHGWGIDPEMWQRADVEGQADLYGLVVVAVEGDDDDIVPSWYSRQKNLPYPAGPDWSISFYDWFFEGVVTWVEANYSVRTDPGGRAVAGFSMGGKGALSIAGHRPDLFTAVAEFGGVMDLRDFGVDFEIPDVYGPLTNSSNQLGYAADSPIELAPNLKGLSITLLHGAEDYFVEFEQSRNMDQALTNLGYPHLWEEISGLDHNVSTYEVTRTFERFAAAFASSYDPPVRWRYRFASDTTRQVYGFTLTKSNPLTWTEIMSVTTTGFDTASGDAFSLTTASQYVPLTRCVVTITNLPEGDDTVNDITTDKQGRLSLSLPAGHNRIAISACAPSECLYLPLLFKLGINALFVRIC
jgi:S-formylglutathione hydrolase FrmB